MTDHQRGTYAAAGMAAALLLIGCATPGKLAEWRDEMSALNRKGSPSCKSATLSALRKLRDANQRLGTIESLAQVESDSEIKAAVTAAREACK